MGKISFLKMIGFVVLFSILALLIGYIFFTWGNVPWGEIQ